MTCRWTRRRRLHSEGPRVATPGRRGGRRGAGWRVRRRTFGCDYDALKRFLQGCLPTSSSAVVESDLRDEWPHLLVELTSVSTYFVNHLLPQLADVMGMEEEHLRLKAVAIVVQQLLLGIGRSARRWLGCLGQTGRQSPRDKRQRSQEDGKPHGLAFFLLSASRGGRC